MNGFEYFIRVLAKYYYDTKNYIQHEVEGPHRCKPDTLYPHAVVTNKEPVAP